MIAAVILGVLVIAFVVGLLNSPSPADNAAAEVNRLLADKAFLATKEGQCWSAHRFSGWTADDCRDVVAKKVSIGMNPEQIRAAWGKPEEINRTVVAGHENEQWVYGRTYLYVDDGKMTSFQDSK